MKLRFPALPSRRRLLFLAGEILLIIALVAGIRAWMARGTVTGPAPAIVAPSLGGEPVSLEHLRGRAVLVYFWATWCPVCRAQQGAIAAVAKDHPVIAIAMQSGSSEAVARYVAEHNWRVTVVNDHDGQLTRGYGVRGVPASFIVDPAGNIRTVEVGYTTGIGLRLLLWWAENM